MDFVKTVLSEEGLAAAWNYLQPLHGSRGDIVVLQEKTTHAEACFPMTRREVDVAENSHSSRAVLKDRILEAIADANLPH
jgi:hypothetical protein